MNATQTQTVKAIIIARTSGDGESSIPHQIANLQKHCKEKGWQIVKQIIEDTISGGKYIPAQIAPPNHKFIREGLTEALEMIKRGEATHIVFTEFSRLVRLDMKYGTALLDYIDTNKINVVFSNDPMVLDFTSPTGVFQINVFLAVNSFYRQTAKTKILNRKKANREAGKIVSGKKSYGYNSETEKANVQRIFGMFNDGKAIREICRQFNAEKIPTARKNGTVWKPSVVTFILKNPNYIGQTKEGINAVDYAPMIATDEYLKAQKSLQANKGSHQFNKQPHVMSGLIYCDCCGGKMQIVKQRNAIHASYVCPKFCRGIPSIQESEYIEVGKEMLGRVPVVKIEINTEAKLKIIKLQERQKELRKLVSSMDISTEDFAEMNSSIVKQIGKLETEISKANPGETTLKGWDDLTFSEKRIELGKRIKRFTICSDGLKCELTIPHRIPANTSIDMLANWAEQVKKWEGDKSIQWVSVPDFKLPFTMTGPRGNRRGFLL